MRGSLSGSTTRDRFAMGAVAFEILSDTALRLEPEAERYRLHPDAHPVVADVICSVAVDPSSFAGASPSGEIRVERFQHADPNGRWELRLHAPRAECSLNRVAPQRYACSARIAGEPSALTSLLNMVSEAIVGAEGGVVMHAAGVELDGRAVLYVGPSCAGKSTAATLTLGAAMFAYDHVAVVAPANGTAEALAYGLPGGTPARMTQSAHAVLPLAGIFRIFQAHKLSDGAASSAALEPSGEVMSGAKALFLLRESVECADVSIPGEQARLHAAAAISSSSRVRVGALHTVLGGSLTPLVRALLASKPELRA